MTKSLDQIVDKKIIAVVGEVNSGKTCLTKRLVHEDVASSLAAHTSTVDESRFTIKKMPDGGQKQIQFIDTAPWQEFPVMHRLYIKNCHLAMVVYNVGSSTWKESLVNMIQQIREIRANIDIIVVGTHSDVNNMYMNLTPVHVQQVIGKICHVYVSSLTGFGITHLWHTMTSKTASITGVLANKTPINPVNMRKSKSRRSMKEIISKTGSFLLCTSKYHTL